MNGSWLRNLSILSLVTMVRKKELKNQSRSTEWKLGVKFKWKAQDTPQQNSLVEVGFTTVGNHGCSMMIGANVIYAMIFKLYKEVYKYATLLDGLVLKELDGVVQTRN